jgi:hypothetical protein
VLQAVAACSPQPRRIKSLPPAAAAAIAIAIVIIPPAAVLGLGPLAPMLITILRIYTPTDLADAPRLALTPPRRTASYPALEKNVRWKRAATCLE